MKISETKSEMVQMVFPEHSNNIDSLHGGKLMDWIMLAGSINSSRISKGIIVLGATDSIDFLNPVKIGELVRLQSWVEYIGKTSMEIGVKVISENDETGEKKLTTYSHLVFVAVDKDARPRRVEKKITPANAEEREIYAEAKKRRKSRLVKIKKNAEKLQLDCDNDELKTPRLETTKVIMPEDAFYGNLMSVGKLMKDLDEIGGILAKRYVKGLVVTGSVDEVYFYNPIRVGDIINFKSVITYVGRSTVEVGINVFSEDVKTGELKHTCTSYLTFVHLDKKGKPRKVPAYKPKTQEEKLHWERALDRKERRNLRLRLIKKKHLSHTP